MMKKKYLFTTLYCMTFAIALANAQPTAFTHIATADTASALSLDSCRALAIKYNKSLLAARKMTSKYGYDVKAYRANYFPKFKLMANDYYSNSTGSMAIAGGYLPTYVPNLTTGALSPNVLTDAAGNVVMGADGNPVFKEYAYFPDMDIDYKVGNIFQAGISIEQPIYMGGKITAAYKMSKIGLEMAELNELLTENEVIVKVETAYMQVVKAQEMNKVAVKLRDMLRELLANVESSYKHGMSPQNDVLKVQVKLNESELQVRQTENALRLASMNLCHLIGQPLTSNVAVQSDDMLVQPETSSPLDNVTNRPEYEILNYKSELAEQQVKLDRSEFLPNVALAGSYSYMHGLDVNNKKLFNKPFAGVLLTVNIPLFHFGEGVNKVKAAKMEKERVLLEQQDLVEQMNLELAQAANNLDEAFMEVELTRNSLAQAEENMRISRNQYELGLETLVNYMEAQTLWQQSYANMINAQCNLFVQGTKYRKAAGLLVQ